MLIDDVLRYSIAGVAVLILYGSRNVCLMQPIRAQGIHKTLNFTVEIIVLVTLSYIG